MKRPVVPLTRVSQMCADGKHDMCLGTVFVYPPEGGVHSVRCLCPVATKNTVTGRVYTCGHGTEVEKARRKG